MSPLEMRQSTNNSKDLDEKKFNQVKENKRKKPNLLD